ncbi:MAG: radical SAM protein [Methanomassiliicoccales archaeon]|nr:radical SAM protein [Methanomassiliicoccales archaeon]
MNSDVLIIDGFVDEPASLGVPPYISPQIRAIAGAVLDAGATPHYISINDLRERIKPPEAQISVFFGGVSVPGKYLRAMPASRNEIIQFSKALPGIKILGGPATFDEYYEETGLFNHVAKRDAAACVYDFLKSGKFSARWRTVEEWNRWLIEGAPVVKKHPDYPQPLIAEIETYRGCIRYRSGGCSFCIEPLKGAPLFREPEDIIREIRTLKRLGVRNFRLGGQTCFISYKAEGFHDNLKLNPQAIETLLSGIADIGVDVIHLDNANPAVIAEHPEDAREILETIVDYCTSGNVLALGMESADPVVIERNNLNATPEQVFAAIKLINDVGAEVGDNGLPKLLPGLNFIIGLDGETKKTLEHNLAFLRFVLREGLLLRRINVRQVMPIRREFRQGVAHTDFLRFKETVRKEIDNPMLQRVAPAGTVLRRVYLEMRDGKKTFGRQIGTYPLLVGFDYPLELGRFVDAIVVGWGYRSVTAIEFPFPINTAPLAAVRCLPSIGEKRAIRILKARPFRGLSELMSVLDDPSIAEEIAPIITFDVTERPISEGNASVSVVRKTRKK